VTADVDEKALFDRFTKKYELVGSELLKNIERSNCGCDYGSTSFTTLDQVEKLGEMLALKPGKRLLDIGAGAGWPGLYLARVSGCDLTLTDLPIEGLQVARQRAKQELRPGSSGMIVANGATLPFRQGWFDAISHADVLCCLMEKLTVLKACREVVSAKGKMVFSVILITPGLSQADHQKAVESGPSFIAAEADYPELLDVAGWKLVEQVDLSASFIETLQVMLENEIHYASELEDLLGTEESLRRRSRSEASIFGVEQGLIRRELFHVVPA